MFEKRTTEITVDEIKLTIWTSIPRGMMEAAAIKGDVSLAEAVVLEWNIAGQSYEGHIFNKEPTRADFMALPADTLVRLSIEIGKGIARMGKQKPGKQ